MAASFHLHSLLCLFFVSTTCRTASHFQPLLLSSDLAFIIVPALFFFVLRTVVPGHGLTPTSLTNILFFFLFTLCLFISLPDPKSQTNIQKDHRHRGLWDVTHTGYLGHTSDVFLGALFVSVWWRRGIILETARDAAVIGIGGGWSIRKWEAVFFSRVDYGSYTPFFQPTTC